MTNPNEQAKSLIANTMFMTLATADESGKPWSCPVSFAYDEAYTLYWVSYKEATHSRNIRERMQVGISILGTHSDGSYDGVYFDAEVHELTVENEIASAIAILHRRPQVSKFVVKDSADVQGNAAWRIYKAAPKAIYKRSDKGKIVNGQAITTRVRVEL